MRDVIVTPAELAAHKSQYLSEGYELRDEKVLSDGRIQLTWRPTCCEGTPKDWSGGDDGGPKDEFLYIEEKHLEVDLLRRYHQALAEKGERES